MVQNLEGWTDRKFKVAFAVLRQATNLKCLTIGHHKFTVQHTRIPVEYRCSCIITNKVPTAILF